MSEADLEMQLEADIASFTHDPAGFMQYAYAWGEGELEGESGPRQWQNDINDIIGNHLSNPDTRFMPLQIAVSSGHGIGKALCEDTVIPTPKGDVRIGDLRAGDFVFGSDGKPTKVTQVKFNGSRPTYKVMFDDDSFVYADENHDWNVRGRQERRKGHDSWRTLSTKEILDLGVLRSNGKALAKQWEIPTTKPVFGSIKNKSAYALGVWIGDGHAGSGRYTKESLEIREKIESSGRSLGKQHKSCQTILGLTKELKRLGLLALNSYQRFLPDEVFLWDEDSRFQLLSGLLDTDGECNPAGSIIYSTSSEALIHGIIRLARSLGYKAQLQKIKEAYFNGVQHRDCYRATITIGDRNPFSVTHKKERFKSVEARYLKRWIASIEKVDDRRTVCISVAANDSLYLANDYIVTHNSAEISMLINWAISTCEDCKVVVTANTETQLRTKTWPEILKWHRLAINSHWFEPTATSLYSVQDGHKKSWIANSVTWSENNTEAFAGLHNKRKRIVVVFDEASAIADKVWEVTEGALTDAETEIIWIVFGNPTRSSGRFFQCFNKNRHRWNHFQIDSRNVEGTNKDQIQKWIEDHGVDSDFVKVRVRGIFPATSQKQFISTASVDAAYGKHLRDEQFNFAPKIIGVDPAWEGDDEFVIYLRQGLMSKMLGRYGKNDNDIHMANIIARFEDEEQADAVFVDGGYGTGIVSAGKTMGRNWQLVWFSGESSDPGCLNKRAEMWKSMRDWLNTGASIPQDPVLHSDLIAPETVARLDGKIQLESKKDMKDRGLASPNRADALGLTFAFPVNKRTRNSSFQKSSVQVDYNPFKK